MKIVVDTNVLVSGVFFHGYPRMIVESIVEKKFEACASIEIITEYREIIHEMIKRKQGKLSESILNPFIENLSIVLPSSKVDVCRDPDDNKFIECALDGKALYIVSGDKDLLVLEKYKDIQIITAKEFVEKYL